MSIFLVYVSFIYFLYLQDEIHCTNSNHFNFETFIHYWVTKIKLGRNIILIATSTINGDELVWVWRLVLVRGHTSRNIATLLCYVRKGNPFSAFQIMLWFVLWIILKPPIISSCKSFSYFFWYVLNTFYTFKIRKFVRKYNRRI